MTRSRSYWRRFAKVAFALAAVACGGDAASGPAAGPRDQVQLVLVGGDEQRGLIGDPLGAPLSVRLLGSVGQGVPGASVTWAVTTGSAKVQRHPDGAPLISSSTLTDGSGAARVRVVPTSREVTVTASVGVRGVSQVSFRVTAQGAHIVRIRFGPTFDCAGPNDPVHFLGPSDSSDVTAVLGDTVEFEYSNYVHPSCTAVIQSEVVPPGGEAFDSGILYPGQRFSFVPRVAGKWTFWEKFSGGDGSLTVRAP